MPYKDPITRRIKSNERGKTYRGRAKGMIVDQLGPGCLLCRFQGWPSALQLHHLEPSKKHPKLKKRRASAISTLNLQELSTEITTCCLLCANCHAGVETGDLYLEAAMDAGHGPTA